MVLSLRTPTFRKSKVAELREDVVIILASSSTIICRMIVRMHPNYATY